MKKRIVKPPDIYSLEKVNERIDHYTEILNKIKDTESSTYSVNSHLLSFWTNYKKNHYPN